MTHAAIGELLDLYVILGDQLWSKRCLIGGRPAHVKDLFAWPDEFFRSTVAFETPFHVEHVRLPRERHMIELPVARGASNALGNMDFVIKKNKVRSFVDAIPAQGFLFLITIAHRLQNGRVFPNLAVASHAGFGGRQPGKGRIFHSCMAIPAVNALSKYVMFVAKRHGLFKRHQLACCPGRPIHVV